MARTAVSARSFLTRGGWRPRSAGADRPKEAAPPEKEPEGAKRPAAGRKGRKSAAESERRPLPLFVRLLVMLVAFAAMVAFGAALAKLTLEPSPASESLTHSNLRPGDSLQAYLNQPELRDAVKQVGGNLLLGVPFGVLLPVLVPKVGGLLRVVFLTAVVMLLVELVQGALITGRAFDIDDVILNTTGALIGYLLLGRRLNHAVHRRGRARKPRGRLRKT
ncbi:VanZ family protein [Streptomyces minutiscleroticus]|uniref:VanZ-like domain-containing protein n=1 Tax=Streptomyces minutiscleroticus TaxID=68238 RepID=A0A918U3G9_9ACTN|nr:VanZ family protein [Streptomyces minutiscleroticus]GGX87724.1 hypothetical protein GCM10010358_47210 [Streptomyces minutiscleroticus]